MTFWRDVREAFWAGFAAGFASGRRERLERIHELEQRCLALMANNTVPQTSAARDLEWLNIQSGSTLVH